MRKDEPVIDRDVFDLIVFLCVFLSVCLTISLRVILNEVHGDHVIDVLY